MQIGSRLCPIEIGLRKSYARAQQTGLTAQEFEPGGKAAVEIIALYEYTCIQLSMDETRHDEAKSAASSA
jgi:chromosome partitioning protein